MYPQDGWTWAFLLAATKARLSPISETLMELHRPEAQGWPSVKLETRATETKPHRTNQIPLTPKKCFFQTKRSKVFLPPPVGHQGHATSNSAAVERLQDRLDSELHRAELETELD